MNKFDRRISLGLQAAALVLALCAAAAALSGRFAFLGAGAGLGAAAASGLSIASMRRQEKLLDFLVRESKAARNRPPAQEWDEEEAERLGLLRRRVELSALQNQINPHFLYNTLDSIRSQALSDGQQDIASMTEKLSKFFRYCISNKENMVKIREEVSHILDYYYIQKYRFEERFEMELKVENEEIYDLYIPKLTLQPLVENAISHGLEKVTRKGIVSVSLLSTAAKVVVTVADNGIGMTEEELDRLNERMQQNQYRVTSQQGRNNGIALLNVNSRIRLTFGEEFGIHYRSSQNVGTQAVVTLPRVDEFERVRYEDGLADGRKGSW